MNKENNSLFRYTLIIVFEGLITGVNIANISGVIPILQEQWEICDTLLGLIIGILMIGCYMGSLTVLRWGKKANKKHTLLLSATLLTISTLGCTLSANISSILIFRFLVGMGTGMIWVTTPVYISDVFSVRIKTTLLLYRHFAVAIGVLMAYITDYLLLGYNYNWRLMLGFAVLLSIIYSLLLLPPPFHHSVQTFSNNRIIPELGSNNIFIAGFLIRLPQLSVLSIIFIYMPSFFEMTGSEHDTALIQSVFVGIFNLLFTLLSTWLFSNVYNRKLLVWGNFGMILSLLYLMYTFAVPSANGIGFTIAICCYISCYTISFSSSVTENDIAYFPSMIISVLTVIIILLFPWLLNSLGGSIAFGTFAGFNFLIFLLAQFYISGIKADIIELETEKK